MKLFLLILTLLCSLPSMAQESRTYQYYRLEGWKEYCIKLSADSYYCDEESDKENDLYVYHNEDKSFYHSCQFLKTDEDFRPHELLAQEFAEYGITIESYDQFVNLIIGNGYINSYDCYIKNGYILSIGVIGNLQDQGWTAIIVAYDKKTNEDDDDACDVISSFRLVNNPDNQDE